MVTKYDLFELIYKKEKPLSAKEIMEILQREKSEYKNIYRLLQILRKEGFLTKTEKGFQIKRSEKSQALYDLIYYCTKNNINYNLLLDKLVVDFMYRGLRKNKFQQKDIALNPKTFKKYIEILEKYGLLLIYSRNPYHVKILYNSLIHNLLVYFGFQTNPVKEIITNDIKDLEKELKLFQQLKKKNEKEYQRIFETYKIQFIHHSLTLEGNPITLPDTIKILKDEIIPRDLALEDVSEVLNYQKAVTTMLKDAVQKKELTKDSILYYHQLALFHRPHIAGKIRTVSVYIRGNTDFKVAPVSEIKKDIDKILEQYKQFIKKKSSLKEILVFASYFHNEFQYIHPFEDGNSRTTRLLMFHILQRSGIPILDIPLGLLDEYVRDTKGAKKREDEKLFQTLQKIILYNLKRINEQLK